MGYQSRFSSQICTVPVGLNPLSNYVIDCYQLMKQSLTCSGNFRQKTDEDSHLLSKTAIVVVVVLVVVTIISDGKNSFLRNNSNTMSSF